MQLCRSGSANPEWKRSGCRGAARRTIGKVLFVGEDEDDRFSHLAIVDYPVQFLTPLVYPVPVGCIDDENQRLGTRVVVPPQGSDLVLPTDILKTAAKR